MASIGSQLQNYNNELVRRIEECRKQRNEVDSVIRVAEVERAKIRSDIKRLEGRMDQMNANLASSLTKRNELDALIQQTEDAYEKILDASRSLLDVIRESTK